MTAKVYYQDDLVTLYHGDNTTSTEWLTADLLVTDPPYGMGYRAGSGLKAADRVTIAGDDTLDVRDHVVDQWLNAHPDSPHMILFGRPGIPSPRTTFHHLVWDKGDSPGLGATTHPFGHSHEEIYLAGTPWARPDGIKRAPSVIRTRELISGAHGLAVRTGHPTPKPIALMEILIRTLPPGTIADPFAGSGSTLIAARNLGRHAIGVELEEHYCETTARRLSEQVLDLNSLT